jgi:hypothetical protein
VKAQRILAALATVAMIAGPVAPVVATKLEKEDCDRLKAEQAQLGPKKLRDAMEKGPEWARSQLTPAEFEAMRRFIDLEEQFLFRCPQPKPALPTAATTAKGGADDDDDEKAPAKKPARKQPAGEAAKAPAEKAPAAQRPAGASATAQPPQPKPKPAAAPAPAPKPKVNDAFVPPPKPAP